jgi:hypothetical protein
MYPTVLLCIPYFGHSFRCSVDGESRTRRYFGTTPRNMGEVTSVACPCSTNWRSRLDFGNSATIAFKVFAYFRCRNRLGGITWAAPVRQSRFGRVTFPPSLQIGKFPSVSTPMSFSHHELRQKTKSSYREFLPCRPCRIARCIERNASVDGGATLRLRVN